MRDLASKCDQLQSDNDKIREENLALKQKQTTILEFYFSDLLQGHNYDLMLFVIRMGINYHWLKGERKSDVLITKYEFNI